MKPDYPKKTRTFCFTNYDLTFDYHKSFERNQFQYIAYGDEICPTTDRPHHQGWVHFHNPRGTTVKVLRKIGEMLGNSHVEPVCGSLQQNESYCSKEGRYTHIGDKPKQGNRSDLVQVIDTIRSGKRTVDEICLEDPGYYHEFGRTLHKAEDILLRKRFRTEMTEGIWLWGPTAVGKSHLAFNGFDPDTHYNKPLSDEWWDGYTGQEVVIFNDFRGDVRFSELLQLVDKWPHCVRRRCREPAPFLAKRLIITSCKSPDDIYKNISDDRESMYQLYRRFEIRNIRTRLDTLEPKCPEGNTNTSGSKKTWDQDMFDYAEQNW